MPRRRMSWPGSRLLEKGPFADALHVAIAGSGLSLDRVWDRLARRGTRLSVATLSSWQSGRRRPERPDSLRALWQLEAVLGLPDNSLHALPAPPRPRGRRILTNRLTPATDVWASRPQAAELLAPFATDSDAALTALIEYHCVRPGAPGKYAVSGDRCSRYFRGTAREYVLEVCFDPAALPVRCRQLHHADR